MKRKSLLMTVLTLMCAVVLILAGCQTSSEDENDGDNPDDLLPAPTDLRVELVGTSGQIIVLLTWTPVPNCTYYVVYRSTESTFKDCLILTGGTLATFYNDSYNIKTNTTFYYKVGAKKKYGNDPVGALSDSISITVNNTPEVVTSIQSTALSQTTIKVTFSTVKNASKYRMWRGDSSIKENMEPIGYVNAPATEYIDSELTAKTQYFFRVSVIDNDGNEGALSAYTSCTTQAAPSPAPNNLRATVIGRVISVSWDPVEQASTYYIYVSLLQETGYATVGSTSSMTSFNVSTITPNSGVPLAANTTYFIKVAASNGQISAPVSATTGS